MTALDVLKLMAILRAVSRLCDAGAPYLTIGAVARGTLDYRPISPDPDDPEAPQSERMDDVINQAIARALLQCNGVQAEAARRLGITRHTITNRLKREKRCHA